MTVAIKAKGEFKRAEIFEEFTIADLERTFYALGNIASRLRDMADFPEGLPEDEAEAFKRFQLA